MSKFAYTTYEKVLIDLRSCLRGNEFNHTTFINEMRLIAKMIIDLCPLVDGKFEKQYSKKFSKNLRKLYLQTLFCVIQRGFHFYMTSCFLRFTC